MVIVNMVNIVASVTFVTAPRPLGGFDLGGIAAGTAIAWGTGAILMLLALLRGLGGIRLHTHRLQPHWRTIRRVIRVGVPAQLESVGHWLGNFLVLVIVGRMARVLVVPAAMGAHIITIRIEAISFLLSVALGTVAATLSGQYLGLGDPARARRAVCICWVLGAAVMGAAGVVFMAVPDWLVWIVTDEPELLARTPPLLIISGPIQAFFATNLVLAFAMRGAGDTRATMLMTFTCTYLIRVPLAYVLGLTFGLGLNGLWIGLCIEHVIRALIFAVRFLHGGLGEGEGAMGKSRVASRDRDCSRPVTHDSPTLDQSSSCFGLNWVATCCWMLSGTGSKWLNSMAKEPWPPVTLLSWL